MCKESRSEILPNQDAVNFDDVSCVSLLTTFHFEKVEPIIVVIIRRTALF